MNPYTRINSSKQTVIERAYCAADFAYVDDHDEKRNSLPQRYRWVGKNKGDGLGVPSPYFLRVIHDQHKDSFSAHASGLRPTGVKVGEMMVFNIVTLVNCFDVKKWSHGHGLPNQKSEMISGAGPHPCWNAAPSGPNEKPSYRTHRTASANWSYRGPNSLWNLGLV